MNKVLYISSLVISLLFCFIVVYYIDLVGASKSSLWYAGTTYGRSEASILTEQASVVSILFLLFFSVLFLLGLIKIKRVTNKILSIIGLCLAPLFILWDLAMLASPSRLSFDKAGMGFLFFGLVVAAFSIVGIVQSNKYKKQEVPHKQLMESDLLDS